MKSSSQFFLRVSLAVILLCGALVMPQGGSAAATTTSTASRPPNFVFILVDDMGYTDVGSFGSTFYETPNIDELASQGVKFTNAYAVCPVCSPSRAGILTGKYPARMDTTDYFGGPQPGEALKAKKANKQHPLLPAPYVEHLPTSEVTIAEALKKHGYRTFMAGKWHLGHLPEYGPKNQGFDENFGGYRAGHPKTYFSPYHNPELKDGPQGEYLTDRLASETVSFIERNRDRPFFAYLSFYAVHIPLEARPDLLKKYIDKKERLGLVDKYTSEGKATVRVNQSLPVYAAMVEAVDQAVGQVTNSLKRLKIDNNTVVIFFSDNGGLSTAQGWPTSNIPLRGGKGWMYEGGVREPLIVKWPGVTEPGKVNDSVVVGTDFYPTMLEMAGLPLMPEQHKDGVSMTGLLKSQSSSSSDRAVYWHYPHYGDQGGTPASCIREGDWKLIKWYDGNRLELFNLKDDLGEQHNLAKDHPDVTAKLEAKLAAWLKSVDAKYPTPNPNYDVSAKKKK